MDTIGNMMIKIKNANGAGKESVTVPYSKFNLAIVEVLKKVGFVKGVTQKGKKVIKTLEIELAYEGKDPKIHFVKRISKLSKRIYRKARDLRAIRQGYGKLIISTPRGIMTNTEAKKEKVGGEALFEIW